MLPRLIAGAVHSAFVRHGNDKTKPLLALEMRLTVYKRSFLQAVNDFGVKMYDSWKEAAR